MRSAASLIATENAEMNSRVCQTLATYLRVHPDTIVVPHNADKYHNTLNRAATSETLDEVFELMWRLNVRGLEDRTVGNSAHQAGSLRDTLDRTISLLVAHTSGRSVHYTELGPEPAKTRYIIGSLLEAGVSVEGYTGIDINPSSEVAMRDQLSYLIPTERISHVQCLFEEISELERRDPAACNVVTMLGFEEGNGHPHSTSALLKSLLRPGDVFMSEMQLLPRLDWSPIYNFYQSKLMRRFSEVTLKRTFGDVSSEYGIYLLPMEVNSSGVNTMVSVLAETVVDKSSEHYGKILVTNYCLKFSEDEFRSTRERGEMRVIAQETTADGSIAFQLSERL